METQGGGSGEGGEQKPDRKEPAVSLNRQTNRIHLNNALRNSIDQIDQFFR